MVSFSIPPRPAARNGSAGGLWTAGAGKQPSCLFHPEQLLEKIARRYERNPLKAAETEQSLIASNNNVRFRFEGALQNMVVVRVGARGHVERGINDVGARKDRREGAVDILF